ncbi:hypothetical protein G6F55_014355 [Rhizopus delemar]|nr:hypothetical protein G6F55_014355 [Rhizopus delemar]
MDRLGSGQGRQRRAEAGRGLDRQGLPVRDGRQPPGVQRHPRQFRFAPVPVDGDGLGRHPARRSGLDRRPEQQLGLHPLARADPGRVGPVRHGLRQR